MYSGTKSVWEYINLTMSLMNISKEELCELLGVTKTAIYNWEKRKDESGGISKGKIVFLCNLFRVTLDEFYQRKLSDDFMNEAVYQLDKIVKMKSFKELKYLELKMFFEGVIPYAIRLIEEYINGYSIGQYGEKNFLDKDTLNMYISSGGEIDYFCNKLKLGLLLDYKDDNEVFMIKDLSSLRDVKQHIKQDFYVRCVTTYDYEELLLLSENILYINEYVRKYSVDINKLVELYEKLNNKYKSFDDSGKVFRLLIYLGGNYISDGIIDFKRSFKKLKEINDMEIMELLEKTKQD